MIDAPKILVYVDDVAMQEVIHFVLHPNYEVHYAVTLRDMTRQASLYQPQLYILDHSSKMEKPACKIIRAMHHVHPNASSLVIDEMVAFDVAQRKYFVDPCGCSNADAYLSIPYKGPELDAIVKKILSGGMRNNGM